MNLYLIKLQKLISESELSLSDQENLFNLFSKAEDKDLKSIVDLFEKNPDQIKIINDFYQAKIRALKNKDEKGWEDTLRQEYEFLKGLE